MDPLKSALAHAAAGWPVIPLHTAEGRKCSCGNPKCHSPGKHPRTKGGLYDATTDEEQIRKWWKKWPDANIGGRLDGLVCIDADIGPRRRAGKTIEAKGDEQLQALEEKHGRLNRLLVQDTGSGSQHILFRQAADYYPKKLARDIDIKYGDGAYIVLHGSNHVSGSDYEWQCGLASMPARLDLLPDAPDWFETAWKGGDKRERDEDDDDDLSTVAHNRPYFESFEELEECVLGDGKDWKGVSNDDRFESRDEWLNFLAAIHFETDGSEDGRQLAHDWSDKWRGGNDPEETDHVWDSFGKRSNRRMKTGRTIAQAAREDGWKPKEPRDDDSDEKADKPKKKRDPNAIEEGDDVATKATKILNRKHALVMNNGRATILNEEDDGGLTWSRDRDFLLRYANDVRMVPGKPTKDGKSTKQEKTVAQIWLKHPKRREYVGVTMAPDGKAGDKYNLWRGFSVKEDKFGVGSCDLLIDHIEKIVCNGNADHSRWFIGWLAHMIQKPEEKPGVAVALRSSIVGTGKSMIGDIMERLLSAHTIKVSTGKQLVGNFNSHLSHAIFVRLEEAFWTGDRAGANVLKDMITARSIRIEPKGVDSFEIPSHHRFLFTSNEEAVVPAGISERRYAVFDVSEKRAGDVAYFDAIFDQLDKGGYEALLTYLLEYDLEGINVKRPPVTAALIRQKIAGAHNVEKWWIAAVEEGALPVPHSEEFEGDWAADGVTVPKDAIYRHYMQWLGERRFEGDPVEKPQFTRKLREWCWRIKPVKPRDGEERVPSLYIPSLDVVRAMMEEKLGKS